MGRIQRQKRRKEKARKQRKDYEKKRNVMRTKPKGERELVSAGDGILPKSKKNMVSNKEKEGRKTAEKNTIDTVT